MDKQQKLLEKYYKEGRDIKAYGRLFPVVKARTCRNCYFYEFCQFPQKPNPNYKLNDFNNNQNRYKLKPAGYCIPVKYYIGYFDVPGYYVDVAIQDLFKIML